MSNMHTDFSKDSLVCTDVHTPKRRPIKRDIPTLYSTDVSYQLQRTVLVAQGNSGFNSDKVIMSLMKFHQVTR